MPIHRFALSAVLSAPLATFLSAQTETSPKGFLTVEANGSLPDFGSLGGASAFRTFYRQVDGTLVGIPARTLTSLKLRRDGDSATNTTALARTVKISTRLAHADYAKVQSHVDQPDTAWLAGAWAVAMTDKSISLPDLRNQPAAKPAPWSITLPLDVPFAYSGQKALAFDFMVTPSDQQSTLAYVLDRWFQFGFNRNSGVELGTGCIPTGKANTLSHGAQLTHWGDGPTPGILDLSLIRGLPDAACWALLGGSNPNASLGLCEKLYCSGEVVLSLPPTNATGLAQTILSFAINPGMVGAKIYSQLVIADPGMGAVPVSISNGEQTTVPTPPVFQKSVAWATWVATLTTWMPNSTLRKDGGLVIGF
jgi:hypothetical protein